MQVNTTEENGETRAHEETWSATTALCSAILTQRRGVIMTHDAVTKMQEQQQREQNGEREWAQEQTALQRRVTRTQDGKGRML